MMKLLSYFVLLKALLLLVASMAKPAADLPDQSGFISIDCGSEDSYYVDQVTKINYTSDAGFIDSGMNEIVPLSSGYNLGRLFRSARIFPEGNRNCYTLRPEKGKNNTYMITARFLYNNYDGKNQIQDFDLYVGEDYWNSVHLETPDSDGLKYDIIHRPRTDYIHVCLHKTGPTIPLISVLELRPLKDTLYDAIAHSPTLELYRRLDLGSVSGDAIRYPDDMYDRSWNAIQIDELLDTYTTSLTSDGLGVETNEFQVPSAVMSTAVTPLNGSSLHMYWPSMNSSEQIFLYLHFAETQKLLADQLREFQIYLNGQLWKDKFVPPYLQSRTLSSIFPEPARESYDISINKTENSTLPPILNAIEIYRVKNFTYAATNDVDVGAMLNIKSYYGVKRNWQGDPCRPQTMAWEGVNCSNYDHNVSIIVSLNLTSSGLNGSIAPQIANLTSLEALDLSNNNLSGDVPNFLAQLPSLKILNLSGNNFNYGSIPSDLIEKSTHGLSFSINVPPNHDEDTSKKNKFVVPVIASTLSAFLIIVFVFIMLAIVRNRRKRKTVIEKRDDDFNKKNNMTIHNKNLQISYSEVVRITNNFERVIGHGGSGKVYYGVMDNNVRVAVKMLNPLSLEGHRQLEAEVNLLTIVHHKNLTSLLGFCNEGVNIGIIYEYMANGTLQQHLSELSCEQRLRILIDVAQGLEYLHHGCKPPIIHRDVKPTNILLNEKFQAKLSDFGVSRAFADHSAITHISTNTVVGSAGYMDPEYHASYNLTEKSDIYSFGVVLLVTITGRPVLDMKHQNRHITRWVEPFLQNGDIRTIIDESFKGKININAAWKAIELAMDCVSWHSTTRPTMNNVVHELKECLALELDLSNHLETESNSQIGPVLESEHGPQVR